MGGGGLWGAAWGPKGTAKRARVPPGCCAVPPAPSQAGQASGTARASPARTADRRARRTDHLLCASWVGPPK